MSHGSFGQLSFGYGPFGGGPDIVTVLAAGSARPLAAGFDMPPSFMEGWTPQRVKAGVYDHSLHKQSALVDALSSRIPNL